MTVTHSPYIVRASHKGVEVAADTVLARDQRHAYLLAGMVYKAMLREAVHPRDLDWSQATFRVVAAEPSICAPPRGEGRANAGLVTVPL